MILSTFSQLIFLLLGLTMSTAGQLPVRILSHNIRFATTTPVTGEKPWAERKQLILDELHYNTLNNSESFICLQEVLNAQLLDISSGLGAEWAHIGVGRNDGKTKGEYAPIFYRPAAWKLDSWKTVWLSETPTVVGSKGWDAKLPRIVTVGRFVHRQTQKKVIALNTHFDDAGVVAREESAKLILQVIADLTCCGAPAVFLAGDLNSEKDGAAYLTLSGETSSLKDVRESGGWRYGEDATFTGFTGNRRTIIDFVFVGKTGWEVDGSSVLPNVFEGGIYMSDHRAVVGDVKMV